MGTVGKVCSAKLVLYLRNWCKTLRICTVLYCLWDYPKLTLIQLEHSLATKITNLATLDKATRGNLCTLIRLDEQGYN